MRSVPGSHVLLLAACALVQATMAPAKPPPAMASPNIYPLAQYAVVPHTAAEASPNHMMRPLNEANTILYSNNFGGGGVATGLLLGPFGVAANVKSIQTRTEKEAAELSGKIAIDPLKLFSTAMTEAGLAIAAADNTAAPSIKPRLDVISLDGDNVVFDVAITVDQQPAGKNWAGRYFYQLDVRYPRATVAQGLTGEQTQALEQLALQGMRELVKLYQDDGSGKLTASGVIKFRCDFLTPRFKFKLQAQQLPAPEGRTVVRMPQSIASVLSSQVQLE